ncbi:hypothetical protein POSPLADRAFT_1181007 [Postia placenta MAD-698-R-SB12]|uniref:Uncharacterized protein n=1 Tax=Postia placenta MAD-698-R-SB12 TaxID=670580 RepID=A0A1X6N2T0_9APHY|nr:hypothetical protein POSPLADRAFT_1181007 [Postia placenta MAD-698-R-SB12]OSX62937.1 hypothetical protein POSPLADRAFT_1181007 [Postia placenta MAD-698-R-SB12]
MGCSLAGGASETTAATAQWRIIHIIGTTESASGPEDRSRTTEAIVSYLR